MGWWYLRHPVIQYLYNGISLLILSIGENAGTRWLPQSCLSLGWNWARKVPGFVQSFQMCQPQKEDCADNLEIYQES